MDLHDSPEDAAFRAEARDWLEANLTGEFAEARGLGRAGLQHEGRELRTAWERKLGADGWTCVGWPVEYGGRGAPMSQQVIWNEEYVRADAPARVNVMGEGLLGPTLIAYGTDEQKTRFLNPIRWGVELWCQGYSEPNAGSDLANVQTQAVLDGDEWVVTGQKVWTSYAQWSDWCFVVCRTDPEAPRHKGLSYLLVPMDQPGVEVRPIRQMTGTSEFNEVFFDGARTDADLVVGEVNDGWRVALATLAFERGVGILGDIVGFRRELDHLLDARPHRQPVRMTNRCCASAWPTPGSASTSSGSTPCARSPASTGPWPRPRPRSPSCSGPPGTATSASWPWTSSGVDAAVAEASPYELSDLQRIFLFSRADTIYGGSNEIQRNIIGERVLGLPPEPKVAASSKGAPTP